MNRRQFLQSAATGALGLMGARGEAGAPRRPAPCGQRPPNLIFVLADDLGFGDLGCYGQPRIRTPYLDRMAAEGMRFTQCYAGSTVCAPSRSCLMTGQHTGHTRVRGNARVPLQPEDVTVAEILKDAGYATGIIGKWGLGEPDTTGIPNRQGFDEWFGYLNQQHAHNYYPDYLWRNQERVALPNVVQLIGAQGGVATRRMEYSHDLFTQEALSFLERHRKQPFFLYLAYTIPHANNEAGEEGMEVPTDEPYSDRPWPPQERNFAAMVTRLDRDIGQLMVRLQELAIEDDTLVFFSSDNGPHREGGHDPDFFRSSGPLRGIKRDLYEGGIRVPMIARWPGHIPAGVISSQVWAFWDFLPTAAELAGASSPAAIDGISLVPALLGGEIREHPPLYWEFHEGGFQQAVRMGDWKGVRRRLEGPLELYNLAADLAEQRDVAGQNPEVVRQMEAFLRAARVESADFPIR